MAHHKIEKPKKASSLPTRAIRQSAMDLVPEDPVDRLLATDFVLIRLGHEIRRHQRFLRESCSEEAWRIYLRIEDLMNERMFTFADKWVAENPRSSVRPGHL